jgi:hypothetical protein
LSRLVKCDLEIVRASVRYLAENNLELGQNWALHHRCQVVPTIEAKGWIGSLIVFVQSECTYISCDHV